MEIIGPNSPSLRLCVSSKRSERAGAGLRTLFMHFMSFMVPLDGGGDGGSVLSVHFRNALTSSQLVSSLLYALHVSDRAGTEILASLSTVV